RPWVRTDRQATTLSPPGRHDPGMGSRRSTGDRIGGHHADGIPYVCGFRGALRPAPAGPLDRLSPRLHSGRDEMLFGVVAGWGTASVEPREWRARFARPVAVYADPALSLIGPGRPAAVPGRVSIPLIRRFDAPVPGVGP